MVYLFLELVKLVVRYLPKTDYPALNSRHLSVSYWLGYSIDTSLASRQDLFHKLKCQRWDPALS